MSNDLLGRNVRRVNFAFPKFLFSVGIYNQFTFFPPRHKKIEFVLTNPPAPFFPDDSSSSLTLTHPTNNKPTPARTTWTLLIYLTGPSTGCVGGSTVFYPEPEPKRGPEPKRDLVENVAVGLEVGMALLHRHGHECMLHEGRPVVEGEKWVIRSDLCVRR